MIGLTWFYCEKEIDFETWQKCVELGKFWEMNELSEMKML
jgi:hypothetical protein